MNSFTTRLSQVSAAVLIVLTVTPGCGKAESTAPRTSTTADAAAPTEDSLSRELGVDLPTQDEADAEAAAEITADNADRIYAELEREVEAEP